ncbi:MAG TPA: hypothetical protein V6C52_07530 [Coleofasciculaceae cyanobacterium]
MTDLIRPGIGEWGLPLVIFAAFLGLYLLLMRPHIAGMWYDDGVYLLGAKSLALGQGYSLLSEAGQPAIVKYPPMLSLVLAPLWWLNPEFPANLPSMKTLNILLASADLGLLYVLARHFFRFDRWSTAFLCLMLGLNPVWVACATDIMSEPLYVFFTLLLLLWCMSLHARRTALLPKAWILGVLLAGLAFYTRSIGISAILGLAFWLYLKQGSRHALQALFLGGLICSAWWLWTSAQPDTTSTLEHFLIAPYNQTYFTEFLLEILKAQGLGPVLFDNFFLFPAALLSSLFPFLSGVIHQPFVMPIIGLLFMGAMVFFAVNRLRRGACSPVAAYVSFYLALSMLWYAHGQYNRLIITILPLLSILILNFSKSHWRHHQTEKLIQPALALVLMLSSAQPMSLFQIARGNTLAANADQSLWTDYRETFVAIQKFSAPVDIFWSRYCSMYPLYTHRMVIARNIVPTTQAYAAGALQPDRAFAARLLTGMLSLEKVRYVIVEPKIESGRLVELVDSGTLNLIQMAPNRFRKVFTSRNGYIAIYRYEA